MPDARRVSIEDFRNVCFVIMPFGAKPDTAGGPDIDFDRVYKDALEPAIEDANLDPIRADEERTGGIIHKPMFERLMLCDYAIADLTTANANVFYELGVRHAVRSQTTLTIFAKHQAIPFDVQFLRSLPYDLGKKNRFGQAAARALREQVTARLLQLRELAVNQTPVDSPVFTLLSDWKPGDIARLKTDVFRDRVQANEELKRRLAGIRELSKEKATRSRAQDELQAFRDGLPDLDAVDAATVVDLLLTHRALEDWGGMVGLVDAMPETLERQALVQEQVAFARNRRAGKRQDPAERAEALRILEAVVERYGVNSETLGLIGRVHKDRWQDALAADDALKAAGCLDQAIDAYRQGYFADQRDAYPGINLLTLLDIRGDEDSLQEKDRLLPVVQFAVDRRLASTTADYWDHATMLELAVLRNDPVSYTHLTLPTTIELCGWGGGGGGV